MVGRHAHGPRSFGFACALPFDMLSEQKWSVRQNEKPTTNMYMNRPTARVTASRRDTEDWTACPDFDLCLKIRSYFYSIGWLLTTDVKLEDSEREE